MSQALASRTAEAPATTEAATTTPIWTLRRARTRPRRRRRLIEESSLPVRASSMSVHNGLRACCKPAPAPDLAPKPSQRCVPAAPELAISTREIHSFAVGGGTDLDWTRFRFSVECEGRSRAKSDRGIQAGNEGLRLAISYGRFAS